MSTWLDALRDPLGRAALTSVAVAAGYSSGLLVRRVVLGRLAHAASRTTNQWDDAVVREVSRRVPFWGALVGVEIATVFWPLPPHILTALHHALLAIAATSLTLAAAAAATQVLARPESGAVQGPPLTGLTRLAVRAAILGTGFLTVLNGLGISVTPVLTALGVGGVAVALALQDTLSNLFSGLYVLAAGQVRVGDYVQLDAGREGVVTDVGWRATTLRALGNNVVIVPNAKLAAAVVTNFGIPDTEVAVLVQVSVDYASDPDHVERVTVDVAREVMRTVPGGVPGFDPFIRYHTFGDSGVGFTVILRGTGFVSQYALKHEFIKRLLLRYRQEQISIPFPVRTLVVRPPLAGDAVRGGPPLP